MTKPVKYSTLMDPHEKTANKIASREAYWASTKGRAARQRMIQQAKEQRHLLRTNPPPRPTAALAAAISTWRPTPSDHQ